MNEKALAAFKAAVAEVVKATFAEVVTSLDDYGAESVKEFAKRIGCGPTFVYNEIKAGRLIAHQHGDKMIITRQRGREYLASLREVRSTSEAASEGQAQDPIATLEHAATSCRQVPLASGRAVRVRAVSGGYALDRRP